MLFLASYQIEGAWNVDGKIPSVWDTATHRQPNGIADGSTGDVAGNSYYFYEKDIAKLKEVGVRKILLKIHNFLLLIIAKSLKFTDFQCHGREF